MSSDGVVPAMGKNSAADLWDDDFPGSVDDSEDGYDDASNGAPSPDSRKRRRSQSGNSDAPVRQSQRATRGRRVKNTTTSGDEGDQANDSAPSPRAGNPSPKEISALKYNHVEDEKERKRLKRLLRNRVSAQQARERKKAYMNNLEEAQKQTDSRIMALEQRVQTLTRENFMLRQVIKTKGVMGQNNQSHGGMGMSSGMGMMEPHEDASVPCLLPGMGDGSLIGGF